MYTVVKTGAKQYRVANGDKITVEKLAGNAGDAVTLETLMGGKVTAQIVGHGRADRVIIFKKKRRKNYHRKNGHRQELTTLQITSVSA